MKVNRRSFLGGLFKSVVCIATATSLPRMVYAAWNEKAFKAETLEGALKSKYPGLEVIDSTAIKLKAPAIAENGAVVPVSVKTDLPSVKTISLFVEKNPSPLAATFHITPLNVADISIRIRMGETSNLIAVVESNGKLHRVQQEVKVTIGGCGG